MNVWPAKPKPVGVGPGAPLALAVQLLNCVRSAKVEPAIVCHVYGPFGGMLIVAVTEARPGLVNCMVAISGAPEVAAVRLAKVADPAPDVVAVVTPPIVHTPVAEEAEAVTVYTPLTGLPNWSAI